jgi:hypothetical protein
MTRPRRGLTSAGITRIFADEERLPAEESGRLPIRSQRAKRPSMEGAARRRKERPPGGQVAEWLMAADCKSAALSAT